ncbi:MAG: STAS/SEC14 domain-containing protein [Candidatus Acidiferrales bacterium]
MIERVEGFPDNVIAVAAKGQVTKKEYEEVLVPEVERVFKNHQNVKFYYELGPEFTELEPGAAWEDVKESIRHFGQWEKMALVTDIEWVKRLVTGFGAIMPGEVRVFPNSERIAARKWVLANSAGAAAVH